MSFIRDYLLSFDRLWFPKNRHAILEKTDAIIRPMLEKRGITKSDYIQNNFAFDESSPLAYNNNISNAFIDLQQLGSTSESITPRCFSLPCSEYRLFTEP